MVPEISEFSYGFALTHELANLAGVGLKAAPIFPSLIEEGKSGGGYDVKLDWVGIPVFLQFKRADCMKLATAKPVNTGAALDLPFYRFPITPNWKSAQHDMLLSLDQGANEVFYVAPRFHLVREFNDAYIATSIVNRSFFIRPSAIGPLGDGDHHVAYDDKTHLVCSEPRRIEAFTGDALLRRIAERLHQTEESLSSVLSNVEGGLRSILKEQLIEPTEVDLGRSGKSPEQAELRRIADWALRYFNLQFFVVQSTTQTIRA
ncbi:hypothetical protein ACTZWT_00010 [Rhodopseudomonas sp. NSM]|uniref:hypothetical protein n=1 Tax=Rhodopseudomonas sp. NSM TaxID=3457630 RepID=UPI0040369A14